MHKKSFKDFVNRGVQESFYVGTGNPNSSILLVGREAAIDINDVNRINEYNQNAKTWQVHCQRNTCEILEYLVEENSPLNRGWGRNTWSKYQKLFDLLRDKQTTKYVDFLKHAFTTEINDSPSLVTAHAKVDKLNSRKQLFKNSAFIQQFPIVILACSDYFVNSDDKFEINEVFDVNYAGECEIYSKYNWFYVHYNSDKTKMVIHTRNLNSNVKNQLLGDLAEKIKEHLNRLELKL
ncbi:hypothetical protein ACYSNM_13435 [Myroides sp. LJL116]